MLRAVTCSPEAWRAPLFSGPTAELMVPRSRAGVSQLLLAAVREVPDPRWQRPPPPAALANSAGLCAVSAMVAALRALGPSRRSRAWEFVRAGAAAEPDGNNAACTLKRAFAIAPRTPASAMLARAEALDSERAVPETAFSYALDALSTAHFLEGLLPATVPRGLLFRATYEAVLTGSSDAPAFRAAVRAELDSGVLATAAAYSGAALQ